MKSGEKFGVLWGPSAKKMGAQKRQNFDSVLEIRTTLSDLIANIYLWTVTWHDVNQMNFQIFHQIHGRTAVANCGIHFGSRSSATRDATWENRQRRRSLLQPVFANVLIYFIDVSSPRGAWGTPASNFGRIFLFDFLYVLTSSQFCIWHFSPRPFIGN